MLDTGTSQTQPVSANAPDDLHSSSSSGAVHGSDVSWVWKEVRKRVFIKLTFSLPVADALAAAIPITLDGDHFVVGFETKNYHLLPALGGSAVRNTIENILRQAAGRQIHFDAIEGTTIGDWEIVRARREKAEAAVMAMAEQQAEEHHYEDVMNQIVGEIRQRIMHIHDRMLPQVRAGLVLDVAKSLADAEEMLFEEHDSRESRRAMARMLDRIATYLDVEPLILAVEVERARRANRQH